jgi:PBP1b-binding outer membrane lipoprotein LpoB
MRILLGLALAAVVLSGCGPQEPEGLANQTPAKGTEEKKVETPAPAAPSAEAPKTEDKAGANQTDTKPEKPLPGPGSEPTLSK